MTLTALAASALTTLFIAFGPLDLAAVFAGLTGGMERREKFAVAWRAVLIAGVVLVVFAFFGPALLGALQVSLDAFRVAGGVLLLLQSIDLIFAHPSGLSALTPPEESEAKERHDIAVFPLAFPLIAGPATMTAAVLLMGRAGPGAVGRAVVIGAMLACLLATYLCMISADLLQKVLRTTGTRVVARVSGVILAALAVQFVFDGVRGAGLFTVHVGAP